jgi:DHA1 family tetracycline resistance protein-like MFS transporter
MESRKAAVNFIFITLLIDCVGWGLIIPVMAPLVSQLKKIPLNDASPYGAWLLFAYAATQFICSPIIGNLSDRYGRRPVILSSLAGFAIDYLFMALAPTYGLLFIGRIIAGITGASFTTGAAYIADVSTPETRVKNFGLIGAAFGLGFMIGPLIGGVLGKLWGPRSPFFAAAILCFLNWLYGYFILPESLDAEHRRKFEWKKANPFGSLKFLRSAKAISGLALCYFLIYLAAMSVQGNWNYFTMYRFHWSSDLVGYSLGAVGLLVGIVQAVLAKRVNSRFGNEKSIYFGLLLYTLGLILFAFATESWMMFVFLIPYCLGGIAGPALQSTMASHVARNEQGALQGALTSLMSLTTIIGPLIMNYLFKYFTTSRAPFYFPGASFFLGAIFMLASAVIAYNVLHREKAIA